MNFCGWCSSKPQIGQYAYQSYRKNYKANQFPAYNQYSSQMHDYNTGNNQLNNNQNLVQIRPIQSVKAITQNLQDLNQKQTIFVKKIMKSNYDQLIQQYRNTNNVWLDNDFPPNNTSVGDIENIVKPHWRRISDILKNITFIGTKVVPATILQGFQGQNYFLSSIAAIAQKDYRIKNLFADLQINPNGIYMVRLLHHGVLKQILVDDFIPVQQDGITPIFAKPVGGREIWIMILEKAWAKLNKSYSAISYGLPNQIFYAITGAPTTTNIITENYQQKEQLWERIFSSYKRDHLICIGTADNNTIQKTGLIKSHAYTILDIYQQPDRLIKLRNPYEGKEWNGRASDKDKQFWNKISPQNKQKLGFIDKNQGYFFMLWQDLINYFDIIEICAINKNASYIFQQQTFDKKRGKIFQLSTNGGPTTIIFSQNSLRSFNQQVQSVGFGRTTLVVAKYENAKKGYQYKYISSKQSRYTANNILDLGILPLGQYVIFAKCDWLRQNPDQATLGIYSEAKFKLKQCSHSTHDKFLFKTFLDHARNNPKKQMLNENPDEWICSDLLIAQSGYGYLVVHLDQKSKKKIGIELNQKDYNEKRLILKKPYKGQDRIKIIVQPGKQLIFLFRLKTLNYPSQITLPTPKIYNLI